MTRIAPPAFLIAVFLAACTSSATRLEKMQSADLGSMITLEQAVAAAQAEIPGGVPVEAKLEIEDDDENEPPAWEVVLYVAAQQQLMEVEVHAETGAILEVEVQEDGDDEED